jgi:hypothetical protein
MKNSDKFNKYRPLMKDLYETAKEKLGFKPDASIYIVSDAQNSQNPLGKTAYYSPAEHKISLYVDGRHIKDILRSLSHELVHHNQNCRGEFENAVATMEGYAQEDGHLREMEREAYEMGNMIFRDWEDNLKSKGGAPLFTSSRFSVPMQTDIIGGRIVEENKMKNKLTESNLRDIIRGVIQEMFDEDLQEDANLPGLDDAEKDEAMELAAEAGTETMVDLEEEVQEIQEEVYEGKAGKYGKGKGVPKDATKDEKEEQKRRDRRKAKQELDDEINEEVEEEVAENLQESFLPKGRDIRTEARRQTFEKLVSKWCK